MFVRVKKVGTYRYLQIAQNRREGKRVKQSVIATLGRLDKLAASGAIDQLLRSAARFAEPAHCAVQMLQLERFGAVDGLVTAPLKRAAVGAGDHETVQHGHEHRAFDIEVMVAGGQQLAHDLLAAGLTPQPFEDQCRADRDDLGVGGIVCIARVF